MQLVPWLTYYTTLCLVFDYIYSKTWIIFPWKWVIVEYDAIMVLFMKIIRKNKTYYTKLFILKY